ncbi:MAG: hypothetical protein PHT54_01080 [Candidatus Nanoarchaeia archaeon]|nr:hypothetical protein [Candidatus Nanoarchaeia archaeon]
MADYYKDGYLEAVLFLFVKGRKILIEHRPNRDSEEIFIPNGRIDSKDTKNCRDYSYEAMRREISEEFSNKVIIKKYASLGQFIVENLKIRFYGFLITEWLGDLPDYTIENGKRFARLEWIQIHEYKERLKLPSAIFFIEQAIKTLNGKT